MAQTNQPVGSSPLANLQRPGANPYLGMNRDQLMANMPGMGQTMGYTSPAMQQWQNQMAALGPGGAGKPMPQFGGLQQALAGQMGAATPQVGDRVASMQRNLSAIQGMQPNQIPRMPGMQPPPGAPPQGPGGAKAPGTPGGAQQMRQQMARLPGGPPPGAPATGPGAGKGQGQAQQRMRQQIAQLPGAPR